MIHTGRGFTGRQEKEVFKNSAWVPMKEGERQRKEGRKREKIFKNVKCEYVLSEYATHLFETVASNFQAQEWRTEEHVSWKSVV